MFKKVLSLLLASAVTASALVGCADQGGTATVSGEFEMPGTVKIICGYGVGGTADLIARKYALVAGNLYPETNFIVENMTGGDGFAAATYFAEEAPVDTTDLLIYGYGAIYRHDLGKEFGTELVDWNRENILPVACIDDRTWVLYATPGTTVEQVLEQSRTEGLKMSGGNPLSDPHLALGSLISQEGGEVIVVPYDGGAAQKKALTDGEVDVFIGTTQAAIEDVAAGTIVPILTFSEEKFEGFVGPDGANIDIPTVAGDAKASALDTSLDHTASILTAGGFIGTKVGADEEWIAAIEEITKAVWADPEYADWIESIMLNKKETYGQDSIDDVEEAAAKAIAAFELLQ